MQHNGKECLVLLFDTTRVTNLFAKGSRAGAGECFTGRKAESIVYLYTLTVRRGGGGGLTVGRTGEGECLGHDIIVHPLARPVYSLEATKSLPYKVVQNGHPWGVTHSEHV